MIKGKSGVNCFHIGILLSIWSSTFQAQSNNADSTYSYFNSRVNEIGNQINYSLDDGVKLFKGITNFDNNDLFYSGALVLTAAASFTLDKEMKSLAMRNQNTMAKSVTDIGEHYGNGLYSVLLSAGLFTTGLLTDNEKIKNTGRILFEALLVSGAAVQIIKIVSGRSRPFLNDGPFMFNLFKTDNPHNSFPSGHTVVAFATSSVLAATIKNSYASIILYSLAGLTAYQRIYSDNHWFSDNVLAAIIGTVVGNALVEINDERFDGEKNRFSLHPEFNSFGVQLMFSLKL